MKTQLISAAALSAVAALSLGSSANAQASAYGLTGNVSGVCVVSSGALLADSSVGKAIEARMKTLVAQAKAELQTEGTAIENEKKSIETAAKSATTPVAQQPLQQRAQVLQQRFDAFQNKSQQRDAELRQTSAKALSRVGDAARPLIRSVANSRNCGLVLDSNSVADANPAMDITAGVVTQLNSSLPTMTVERERLDAAAAAR